MFLRTVVGPLFAVALFAGSLSSTQNPTADQKPGTAAAQAIPTLKANTRLVVVDVIATDAKGQPVEGINAQDFTILEDGKEQVITDYSFRRETRIVTAPRVMPANVVTNIPQFQNASSLNVILLDTINGEFTSRANAQARLINFLESHNTIQPTAIFVLEKKLRLLHDFTTDPKSLKEVLIDYKNGQGASRMQDPYLAASPFATHGDFHTDAKNIDVTLQALKSLADILAGYPGRKNLIWLSEVFPQSLYADGIDEPGTNTLAMMHPGGGKGGSKVDPDQRQASALQQEAALSQVGGASPENFVPGSGADYKSQIIKISNALMDAHVALYPIDSAGLGRSNRTASQSIMELMAARTGGKAFFNRNDLDTGVRGSIDDGSTYYTLSYYPSNKVWDGKFRTIEIRTNRPDVRLRYRVGYYAVDPTATGEQEHKKLVEEFGLALALDSPDTTAVLFDASVAAPEKGQSDTRVTFSIDPRTVSFDTKDDGKRHAEISCAVVAYAKNGALVAKEITSISAAVKLDDFPKLTQKNFTCHRSLDLKPGKYTLKLGVVDGTSGMIGTAVAKLTVP